MAERQKARTVAEIRGDHVGRYQFAAEHISGHVLDLACGCGYGAEVFGALRYTGADISGEAVAWAREYFNDRRREFICADLFDLDLTGDVVVSFETIEHVEDAGGLVRAFRDMAPRLIASVPNDCVLPFTRTRFPYHVRHYTPGEFAALLEGAGWRITRQMSQHSAFDGTVSDDVNGRTLVYMAE